MNRIRTLIVDDAVVVRRVVSGVLASDPEIEVVGACADGVAALRSIEELAPDVVVLDVEMPQMDGLEALTRVHARWPRLPVIMFSTLTQRGASTTLEALSRGARDYVTKPTNSSGISSAASQLREQLLPKVKLHGRRHRPETGRGSDSTVARATAPPTRQRPSGAKIDAIAIGVSTGGPNALAELLPALPADLPVPLFITQHMPPLFTRLLAERLDSISRVRVVEAAQSLTVSPGRVYLAPGDWHMVPSRNGVSVVTTLNQGPPENSCRPAVDAMLRGVVEVYGAGTLAVILTGMGQDGLVGAEQVAAAGGLVIVQDEASSVVWGMPGAVHRAGLASETIPLPQIADRLARIVRERRAAGASIAPQPVGG